MLGLKQFCIYLFVITTMGYMSGCAEESGQTHDQIDVIEVGGDEGLVIEDQVHHQVPTPAEMMDFIKSAGGEFSPELLCSPDAAEKYVDLKGKSMGMGIYIADLAYAVSFSQFQESMKLFDVIVSMSEEVGISGVFDEAMLGRMKTNLNDPDSLEEISNQSYYEIIAELENNERGKVVGMIAAGGFVESLFISVQSVDRFDENDPMMKRIASQKLIYENIMAYLEDFKDDQNVEWTIQDMTALKSVFDDISDNRRDTKFTESEGGKKVLGGKGGVYLTEQEFEELRHQSTNLRNMITFNATAPQ